MLEEIGFKELGVYDLVVPNTRAHVNIDSNTVLTPSFRKGLIKHVKECVPLLLQDLVEQARQEDPDAFYLTEEVPYNLAAGKVLRGLTYAIENSYTRGNNFPHQEERTNNGYLQLTVKSFCGDHGLVFRVRDSGQGFGFVKEIAGLSARIGKVHGMQVMNSCLSQIAYEGNGSIANLMLLNRRLK